jgi:hypothetical protein
MEALALPVPPNVPRNVPRNMSSRHTKLVFPTGGNGRALCLLPDERRARLHQPYILRNR